MLAAQLATAADRKVSARVVEHRAEYLHALSVADGAQASFTGNVRDKDGRARGMILNVLLQPAGAAFAVTYQLEVGDRGDGTSIQAQGEVLLRPGETLRAVECGKWLVDLGLDGPARASAGAAGQGNVRVTAELKSISTKNVCKHLAKPGSQTNVAEKQAAGSKLYGLVWNALVAGGGKKFSLQYQLAFTPTTAPKGSVQLQGEEKLVRGRKALKKDQGYWLELSVD